MIVLVIAGMIALIPAISLIEMICTTMAKSRKGLKPTSKSTS